MLAAHGAKVVVADMQAEKGQAVAAEINGGFVRCDVSSEADGLAVVQQAPPWQADGSGELCRHAPAEKTVGNTAPTAWRCTRR